MASRRRWSISITAPWRTASLLSAALACAAVSAQSPPATFPPAPDARPAAEQALAAGRDALFRGDGERALRLLSEARPALEEDPRWVRAAALDALALGRPYRAMELFARLGPADPQAPALVRALLRRVAAPGGPAPIRPSGQRWPGLTPEFLRTVVALRPARDGGVVLLTAAQVHLVGADGLLRASQPLPGGVDLNVDAGGLPLALGRGQFFLADHAVALPPTLQEAVSIAATPDGRILVLDAGARALVILDGKGALLDRKPLSVQEPGRVRVDGLGRVFVTDRRDRSVAIFRGDLTPLRSFSPERAGLQARRVDDLQVDVAGDMLLLDARKGQLALVTAEGRILGESAREAFSATAVGWDGLDTFLVLDERALTLGRAEW